MSIFYIYFLFHVQAVRHLPPSAQLEYRRLVNRMKLLEKQKEQKSLALKKPPQQKPANNVAASKPTTPSNKIVTASVHGSANTSTESTFHAITVTVQNNKNRLIQSPDTYIDNNVQEKSASVETASPKAKDSLAKKVLLKNAASAKSSMSEEQTDSSIAAKIPMLRGTKPSDGRTIPVSSASVDTSTKAKVASKGIVDRTTPLKDEQVTHSSPTAVKTDVVTTQRDRIQPPLVDLEGRTETEKRDLLQTSEREYNSHR